MTDCMGLAFCVWLQNLSQLEGDDLQFFVQSALDGDC